MFTILKQMLTYRAYLLAMFCFCFAMFCYFIALETCCTPFCVGKLKIDIEEAEPYSGTLPFLTPTVRSKQSLDAA